MNVKLTVRILSLLLCTALGSISLGQDSAGLPNLSTVLEPDFGPETGSPKVKANIDSFLLGRNIEDNYFKTSSALLDIVPHLDIKYNSWLWFDVQAEGVFVAGNTQSFYVNEGASINAIFLDEAAANFDPLTGLEIRAGALYTGINPLQSVMSQNCFMGATEKYEIKLTSINLNLTASANESVPSSGTITRGLIDDSPNAYFMSQTLQAELKVTPINTTFKLASTHFGFGNLSSNVASDSALIGNSPQSFEGIGPNTRYTIGFDGFESAGTILIDWLPHLSSEFTGSAIINNQASADRNYGTQAVVKMTAKFTKFNLTPSYALYDVGADVTPATYTIMPYRYQNRDGFTAMLNLELKKEKVNFYGSYSKGDVIEPNPYMADRETYILGLEAKYDLL